MKFSKIKATGKKVVLIWTTSEHGVETEHHVTSDEEPKPEFPKALDAFVPFVIELLGLTDNSTFRNDLHVTGLSIDVGEDERRGLVITCRKELARTNGPLIFNLPHIREPKADGTEAPVAGVWLVGMDKALQKVQVQAQKFLDGERSQTTLELQHA
ncbi:MAG TPA: hypothetical protein VN513_10185 [Gemmatimonadales bacterium]|nr:hypothetical protein [Gemmatimonadales bacterium]